MTGTGPATPDQGAAAAPPGVPSGSHGGSGPLPAPALPGRHLSRYATLFFLASLLMALGVLSWSAARPYADWPHTSDDMFYYLTLARESVGHGVVSSDGVRPTNGFHPLYFLLLRAVYPLTSESALPGVALGILTACHALTSVVLWLTLRRLAGSALAGLLAGLYAASPYVLGVVFSGVETALACLMVSVALAAHARWLDRGGRRDRALSLLALLLAVAARTDAVMLAAGLALAPALPRWREPARALRALDRAPLWVALLPVVAFGIWGQWTGGEFIQTSGRSLSFWQSAGDWRVIRGALVGLGPLATPAAALAYLAYALVQFVTWLLKAPVVLLREHPLGLILVGAGIGARLARPAAAWGSARHGAVTGSGAGEPTGAVATGSGVSDRPGAAVSGPLARALIAFLVLLWAFYATLFRHGQGWYWHTSVYASALLVALWLAPLRVPAVGERVGRLFARLPRAAPLLLLATAVGLAALALDPLRPRPPARAPAAAAGPPAAQDPLARVPDGATLGAFDTGRLAWEHPRLRVVNLDGLVNNAAYRALRARRIGRYMLEERVEWLYVVDKVVARFAPFGLGEWLAEAEEVGRNPAGVALYRLRRRGPADP